MKTLKQVLSAGAVSVAAMVGMTTAVVPQSAYALAISINETVGGEDLVVTGDVSVTAVDASEITVGFSLSNDSTSGARVTSFGWTFDPASGDVLTLVNDTLTDDWTILLNGVSMTGPYTVDVCISQNDNNCTGGAGGGLLAGADLIGSVTLGGSFALNTVIADFYARFQSVGLDNSGSIVLPNGDGGGGGGGDPLPVPGSLALIGLGLLAAGAVRRRKS
jgi:hypothetical protein